jgi:hypothetical protein
LYIQTRPSASRRLISRNLNQPEPTMIPRALAAAALLACSLPLPALADAGVDVEILDHRSGAVLPVYWHDGERHVAGEPGCEYEIRLRNRSGSRVLAITSVDGVNVITGQTAAIAQSGYVLDPWGLVDIDGWRKSMDQVAAFYFTALPDSYAARTGRPDNVGVIGIALFSERVHALSRERAGAATRDSEAPAPAASAELGSGNDSMSGITADSRLGTGHGERRDSGAVYTQFERANAQPDEVIRIYYDKRRNLVAHGVIPRPKRRFARDLPDPFPQGFVPDP